MPDDPGSSPHRSGRNRGEVTSMFDLWLHRLTIRGLYVIAMGKAFLRFRDPRRRAAGRHHAAFYERTWREAAAEIGATFTSLTSDIGQIDLDGVRTRVDGSVSAIDDPVTL